MFKFIRAVFRFGLSTFFLIPIFAQAGGQCIQTGNTVSFMGLDGYDSTLKQGSVYLSVGSTANQCGCTHVRFKPHNTDTDDALAIAMAARVAGITLRIDLLDSDSCDSAYRIYLEG
jgi:hypothetical protein